MSGPLDTRLAELRTFLVKMQRQACCYSHQIADDRTSGFCDCKYGGPRVGSKINDATGHEQTGCPELREVEALFRVMTDKEFVRLWDRVAKAAAKRRKKP